MFKKDTISTNIFAIMIIVLLAVLIFTTRTRAAIVATGHKKYSYDELVKDIESLKETYPDYIQYNVIGKTPDNRKLYEVVLGNPDAKKHLLVISNLHAREYMTTQLSMAQIERYCKLYSKKIGDTEVSKTLNKVAVHYIPSCNPDGTAISQFGFSAIKNKKLRKSLRKMGGGSSRWKANARGVDLNRNWAIAWRHSGSRGAAGYRGPKAASEPEIKALVKWFNALQGQGEVAGIISYHSTGSILYGRCASQATFRVKKETTKMYKLARKLTGYRLVATESISSARGCSREYFLYKRKVPFITLEIGHGSCPLGAGEFSSIWNKNKDLVIKEAMLFD